VIGDAMSEKIGYVVRVERTIGFLEAQFEVALKEATKDPWAGPSLEEIKDKETPTYFHIGAK
jgi:hypothetical protein